MGRGKEAARQIRWEEAASLGTRLPSSSAPSWRFQVAFQGRVAMTTTAATQHEQRSPGETLRAFQRVPCCGFTSDDCALRV